MPVFRTRPGQGKISNFGYDFDEVGGTEVDDTDVAERLRKHFQFEEVAGAVKRETIPVPVEAVVLPGATQDVVEPLPVDNAFSPVDVAPTVEAAHEMPAQAPIKRKGRQPFPRDAEGNIIRPDKTP